MSIRSEQDEAYEESLRLDQIKDDNARVLRILPEQEKLKTAAHLKRIVTEIETKVNDFTFDW
jgi:hypothetical protein